MLDFERILKNDRQMRELTGINLKAFNAPVPSFTDACQDSLIQAKSWRMRALGGGRKSKLETIDDRLLFILIYFKCYSTLDVMGSMFDFSRSTSYYRCWRKP
jgi:hypothetical protein